MDTTISRPFRFARLRTRLSPLLLACLVPVESSTADTLVLKNGDSISGQVTVLNGNTLSFQTDYAGTLQIDWSKVVRMHTDNSVTLLFNDYSMLKGRVTKTDQDTLQLTTADNTTQTVPLDRLSYINPPPDMLNRWVQHVSFNLGLNASSGNTNNQNLHVDGEWKVRDRFNGFKLGGQYNRQRSDGEDTADNGRAYFDYNRYVDDKWYGLLNSSVQIDRFSQLDYRVTVGPGVGYQFWSSDIKNLSLELGINYVNEVYTTTRDQYASGRWALDYDQYFFSKRLQFYLNHTGLESLENISNLVLHTRTGLKIPIDSKLSTSFEVDIDYNNSPPPDTQKTDLNYIVKAGYSW